MKEILVQSYRKVDKTGIGVSNNDITSNNTNNYKSYRKVDKTGIGVSPKLWGSNYLDVDR